MSSWTICPDCRQTVTTYELATLSSGSSTARTDEIAPVERRISEHKSPARRFDYCSGSGRRAA